MGYKTEEHVQQGEGRQHALSYKRTFMGYDRDSTRSIKGRHIRPYITAGPRRERGPERLLEVVIDTAKGRNVPTVMFVATEGPR